IDLHGVDVVTDHDSAGLLHPPGKGERRLDLAVDVAEVGGDIGLPVRVDVGVVLQRHGGGAPVVVVAVRSAPNERVIRWANGLPGRVDDADCYGGMHEPTIGRGHEDADGRVASGEPMNRPATVDL